MDERDGLYNMVVQLIEEAAEEWADTAGPAAQLVQFEVALTEQEYVRPQLFVAVSYDGNGPVRG